MKGRKVAFRTQTITSLLFLIGSVVLSVQFMFFPSSYHEDEYAKILSAGERNNNGDHDRKSKVRQTRENVSKDLLIASKNKRLQLRVESEKSDLSLESSKGKTDMIEHMRGVHCYMQEDILKNPPMQIVRHFDANDAVYSYKKDMFTANDVVMDRSLYQGNSLDSMGKKGETLLEGVAETVKFSPAGKTNAFKAKKLKAVLHKSERVL